MMKTDVFLKTMQCVNLDTSRLRVIFYILERTDPKTYIFNGSADEIAKAVSVSYSTVTQTLKAAQEAGLLKHVGRSTWHIEDDVFDSHGEEPIFAIRNYR